MMVAEALVQLARHVQHLAADEVPVFGYEEVKGLELDGVVVIEPNEVLDGSERGARLVYVALDPGRPGVDDRVLRGAAGRPAVGDPGYGANMSEPPVDGEDHREPVIVATFVDIGEAEIAMAKLRAFGIESAVLNQAEGGTIPTVELPLGIAVEVKSADADDAFRILSDT